MTFSRIVLVLMALLALAGAVINAQLTALHTSEAARPAWFESVCTPEDSATFDCKEVLKTKWAVFSLAELSFSEPDPETGRQPGIPVALLGWFYFSAVFVWYALVGKVDYQRRFWHALLLATVACACAVSVFFLYVLFTKTQVKCIWCMVSHAINFCLLIGTVLLWPRRPRVAAVEESSPDSPLAFSPPPHPSGRLLVATVAAIVLLMGAEQNHATKEAYRRQAGFHKKIAAAYKQKIDAYLEDTESQLALYKAQEAVKIPIRKDDPRLGEGKMMLPMVVFGDFQCPPCRKFAKQLEEEIIPQFDGNLRVYWKHLPWCQDCNPHSKINLHPEACRAAYAAEAARIQGGNDAFWKVHHLLYEEQKKLKGMDYRALAERLELDPDKFIADMESDAVHQRVKEDIDLAVTLRIRATPAVYIMGRKVNRQLLGSKPFLEGIKREYMQIRKAKLRHNHRKGNGEHRKERKENGEHSPHAPAKKTATPDNPGPPDAP